MSIYAPIRDAFSEINKLMIDKERWDAEHAYRAEEQGMRRMQMDAAMEDRKRRRIIEDVQIKEAENALKPVQTSIYDYAPNREAALEWLKDPEFRSTLARTFDGTDVDMATGTIIGEDKSPVMLANADRARRIISAQGLFESKTDPLKMIEANQVKLTKDIADVESQLKGLKDIRQTGQRAPLEERLSKLKIAYSQHDKMKEPNNLLEQYRGKLQYQQRLMLKAAADGAQEPIMAQLRAAAQMTQQTVLHMEGQIEQSKKWGAELELGKERNKIAWAELAARKAKDAQEKNERATGRLAYRTGPNGELLDTTKPENAKWVSVPQSASGSPEEIKGKEYKGFIWADAIPKTEKPAPTDEKDILRNLKSNPKWFSQNGLTGQLMKNVPDAEERLAVAEALLPLSHKRAKDMGISERQHVVMTEADKVMDKYWSERLAVYQTAISKGKSEEEAKKLAALIDDEFYKDFNFVPNTSVWKEMLKKEEKNK